jgi:hypothetical protein
LADWLCWGEDRIPDYEQYVEVTGLSVQTMMNYLSVARAFEGMPRLDVPFSVYEALAPTARREPEAALTWLQTAEAEGMTGQQVRDALRPAIDRPKCEACGRSL